jgi:hypothetical protein
MLGRPLVAVALLVLSGCTTVRVQPIDPATPPLERVCIERNPKVIVADFVPVVQAGFERHGIATAVYDPPLPEDCEHVMTYTARRGWDFVPYLKYAELEVRNRRQAIGSATYRHAGGLGLNKWASTRAKMTPVIDALLGPPAASPVAAER